MKHSWESALALSMAFALSALQAHAVVLVVALNFLCGYFFVCAVFRLADEWFS